MDYLIREYAKMRQQKIQQEFDVIHRARMSRPVGLNRQRGEVLRGLKNVLVTWCGRLGRRGRQAWLAE